MAKRRHPHHLGFPRQVARFLHLEGGQYGTLELIALTPHQLEMQLGADFVRFTRRQAEDLRDAVQVFLDFGAKHPPCPPEYLEEEVTAVIEETVEIDEIVVGRQDGDRPRRRHGRRSA
jgi:hypothetical protein